MSAPAPLTPPDCDLRAFRDLPLDVGRFRDSGLVTHESAEAVVAAIHLWGAAWHQIPAASLPTDDKELARFAGYGRAVEAWLAVKHGALRGFVLCTDGRLYNKTLAEKANTAWDKRLRYEHEKARDRHRKAHKHLKEDDRPPFPEFEQWREGLAAAPAAPTRKQGDLPLESGDHSGGTPPVRARARTEGEGTERARTGATDVPSELSAGNADDFQRNDPAIPAETPLKGREGKGREESQSGDSEPLPASSVRTPAPAREDPPGRLADADLKELYDAVSEAAGFNPINPGAISRAMAQVEAWRDEGVDFDRVVLPAIRDVVADTHEPTRTLGRFRDRVAHAHARSKAQAARGGNGSTPAAPVVKLAPDDPDERLEAIRKRLRADCGARTYDGWLRPMRLHIDGATLQVQLPSTFMADWVGNNFKDRLTTMARTHGFEGLNIYSGPSP